MVQTALQQMSIAQPRLTPEQVKAIEHATGLAGARLALALLPQAQQLSLAPVSNFAVGAIAMADSGYWYLGANLEFAGLALHYSVHAEQSAIGHAALHNEQHIQAVVVSASPCGHCRQFMQELNQPVTITLPEAEHALSELLPYAFGPADLGIDGGMLSPEPGTLHHASDDTLLKAALQQANLSYAPYSHNRAGVALQLADGRIITGRYLENAAFNPGLGPMQLALSQLQLQGGRPEHITRAVLVESAAGISQYPGAAQLLAASSAVTLEHVS